MGTERRALWGTEYPESGKAAVTAVGDRVALGLARGWRPKPYWYLDPNEDAVAAVVGARATLLVVADGHNGAEGSHAAVQAVLHELGDDPPPSDLGDADLVALFETAAAAVSDATARLEVPRRDSRTTLTVALLADSLIQWAAMGDSALLVAGARDAVELTRPLHHFVGPSMTSAKVAASLLRGKAELSHDAWVVLATDGYTNFLPAPTGPADATRVYLRNAHDASEAVELLMERARAGGAGDNVALAVVTPRSWSQVG